MHGATHHKRAAISWSPGGVGATVDLSYCKGKIRITGFGRYFRDHEVDWSFRPFQTFEHGKLDILSTRLLPEVASVMGIREMVAPHPEFGTTLCTVSDLRTRIPFEHGGKRVVLLRGAKADITILAPGETFAISVGGCPVGWMYDPVKPDRLIVAHMGLQCLIDRPHILTGQKSRRYASVIARMWESMHLLPDEAARVQAGFAFPIHPLENIHEWDYPGTGEDNKLICHYLANTLGPNCVIGWNDPEAQKKGRIHLGNIIRHQYAALGIPTENMHGMSSPDTMGTDGHPLWYVTRGPHGKDPRNLVLITFY